MLDLKQDVAYAIRAMRRAPAFTAIAVLTLAAGIGVNTAMFSVVNAVLLRPLPYAHADSLLALWNRWAGTDRGGLSIPEFLDLRDRLRTADVAVFARGTDNLTGRGEPERLTFTAVTANWLAVHGVTPALGRDFRADDEVEANASVIILSDRLWRRAFGASPSAIGATLRLGNRPFTVIGVLPPGFEIPSEFDAVDRSEYLRPFAFDPATPRNQRGSHFLLATARPRPGFTPEQVAAEVAAHAQRSTVEYPGEYSAGYAMWVTPLQAEIVRDARGALIVLIAAVALVLLIACANVANLLLARAKVRALEMSLRKAIGATPARLARQVLTEAVVLAVLSAGIGLLIAWSLLSATTATASMIPRIDETTLDWRVLAFTIGVSLATAVLFGSAPALQTARGDVAAALHGPRGSSRSALRARFRTVLVSVQVALALVLLVGAALLVQSFSRLLAVPSGFTADRVLTLHLSVPVEGYQDRARVVSFYDRLLERLRTSPGVDDAGAVAGLPLQTGRGDWDVYLEGETPTPTGSDRPVDWQIVTPGDFETMRIRLVRGRFPATADRADSMPVAVINERFARTHFPNVDPVGRQVRMSGDDRDWMTVIGVAGDVKQDGLDAGTQPEIYLPHSQFRPFWQDSTLRDFTVVIRAAGEPTALAGIVRSHVRELDPNLPIATVTTLENVVSDSVAQRRLHATLFAIFAAVALLLAAIGTYGVLTYQISDRMPEFGVRLALGASRRNILGTVLRQGLTPTLAGIGLGLVAAAILTRGMAGLLFGITPFDPATYAAVAALLVTAALAACLVPARRALRVDPGTALRAE